MKPLGGTAALTLAAVLAGTPQVSLEEAQTRIARAADMLGRNENAQALRSLEQLAAEAVADNPRVSGELQFYIGLAHYRLSKYADAEEHWRLALEQARVARDRAGEARTRRALAQMRKNQGQYASGIALAEEAIAIYDSLGDPRNVANTWIVVGAIHDLIGEHRQALESYTHALPVIGREQSPAAANLQYEMGITYKNLGDYAEALRCYDQALDIYTRLKDPRNQAFVLGNIGVLYLTIGDDERGIAFTHQALTLVRQAHDRRGEAIGLVNLAEAYWRLGDSARAVSALKEQISLAREIDARSEMAEALKNLGDIHAVAGSPALAREEYDEALRTQREMGERRTEGETLIALSDLDLREHHDRDAFETARRALAIAQETERPELEWNARRSLAAVEAAGGQASEAIEDLRASARIVNDLRATLTSDSSRIAFIDRRQDVFQDLAALLLGAGRADEALEAAEAARARAFADLLEQRQIVGKPRDRDALAAVRRTGVELQHAASGSAGDVSASPSGGRRSPDAFDATLSALGADHHELASLLTARSPRAGDIAAIARRLDATLVEYLVTADAVLAWVVAPDGVIHGARMEIPRRRLESLTRDARNAVAPAGAPTGLGRRTAGAPLRELDRLLIAPVARWLPRSAESVVVIVPYGPLVLVPFAALEDSARRPLIERHVLSFAPAASVYLYTQDKRRAGVRRTLIVSDPVPPAGSGIERLPGAREEGERIAERLRGTPVRLLTGAQATEAAVKREAGQYSVLHFATHGLVAPERPFASSLLLAAGDAEDGYLRVDEIFNLDLSADLVVLSGCSTGLGRLTGDGVVGMTRAFLYAGTPTVVVSQWNVSDRATARLMDRFYAELTRGRSTAQALQAAALATRRQFPHPSSWAAFEVVGEPR